MKLSPEGHSADQIAQNAPLDISTWHVYQAASWVDYAKRTQSVVALHYASLELRLGLEYLLFEFLYMVANPGLTEKEYQDCLGDPDQIKRLILKHEPKYEKLCAFTRITLAIQPGVPRFRFWKLGEIMKYWGIASELCHFPGTHGRTYANGGWFIKRLARIEKHVGEVLQYATSASGHGLADISSMPPEVLQAWREFSDDKLAEEDLKIRLTLMEPILHKRRTGCYS